MYDAHFLRSAAIASIENAEAYLEVAELLQRNGHNARAQSLSILGKEEAGKALMFALAALDAVPDLRKLMAGRYQGVTHHALKQVLANMAGNVEWMVDEYADIVASEVPEAGGMDLFSWLTHFVDECARAAEDYLRDPGKAHGFQKALKQMSEEIRDRIRSWPKSQTEDEKKMAGFYVDISDGTLSTPLDITAIDARSAVADLTGTLDGLRRFKRALEDDGLWDDLAARYQRA